MFVGDRCDHALYKEWWALFWCFLVTSMGSVASISVGMVIHQLLNE